MKDKSTSQLMQLLNHTRTGEAGEFLRDNEESLIGSERPFSDYFKGLLKQKGILLQEVFLLADIPERYGYKLISGEKHTRQRDIVLRLCLAGRLSTQETQRALNLYGMASLYPRLPRDAVLLIALNQELHSVEKTNELLARHGLEPLAGCRSTDE